MNAANYRKNCIRLEMTSWGYMIHWELCKKLNFDHSTKYKKNRIGLGEWGTKSSGTLKYKHLIRARRPGLALGNKKSENLRNNWLCCTGRRRIKFKGNEKRYKYWDLARELRKLLNIKVSMILIIIGAFGTIPKGLKKGTERVGNWRSRDNADNCIVTNTEKSPGDFRRLAVS